MTVSSREAALTKIQVKSREFRLATIGLSLISAASFSELYCSQGILPQIAHGLRVSGGDSQLTVLAATGGLAVGMIPASLLSERRGRRNVMLGSAVLAALVGLIIPFCFSFAELVVLKALQGLLLSGVPAVALAYIGEEFEPAAVMPAMGRFAAGTALGGVLGRMLPVWVEAGTDSWRSALGSAAALSIAFTSAFVLTLPHSKFFTPTTASYLGSARHFGSHLATHSLIAIYLIVFCVMGAYVSMYNGLPFHIEADPFNVPPGVFSLFFLVNLVGVVASPRAGAIAGKIGPKRTLLCAVAVMLVGVVLLTLPSVWLVVLGTAVVTAGGFAGHTCLTGLIATIAKEGRAQAAALYSVSFYGASAAAGFIGSRVFVRSGWSGLVEYTGVLIVVGAAIALTIRVASAARRG